MAKKGLDYFSLDVDFFDNDKVALIEAEFGMKGIIILLKLLCKIYSEGYYCEWGEEQCLLFTSRKLKPCIQDITGKFTQQVVDSLARRNFFNLELYKEHNILTSRSIQERYNEAVKRRQKTELNKDYWLLDADKNVYKNEENVYKNEENVYKNEENVYIFSQRKEKKSKVKESKYNNPPPQERLKYNNSNTRERGGGQIKDIYGELCKKCPERADVWEAAAISNSFQNHFTEYYTQWLQLTDEQRAGYQLYQLNTVLRKECGEINLEWYNALYWCKDNLLQTQFCEIYTRLTANPAALSDLTKLIKEVGKGKINNPGLFILSRLRQ